MVVVVVMVVVGRSWLLMLGVLSARVTRSFALSQLTTVPLIVMTRSVGTTFSGGLSIVIWAPDSSVMVLIFLPAFPITLPQKALGTVSSNINNFPVLEISFQSESRYSSNEAVREIEALDPAEFELADCDPAEFDVELESCDLAYPTLSNSPSSSSSSSS